MSQKDSIIQLDFTEEMRNSYRDYAVSVIISRALPDVRDGLKPVQRRILYAMTELGLAPDKPHRKSARIVGDTMGKYHPHGDSSIYDALVHMTEEYSLSIPLVDGHGNFGSIDGDSAAAMRYTEARLSPGAMTMLDNLDKQLVPFGPNFDESEKEPLVLPATLPNLLINGTTGIAVGMATNMPPHNPAEVIDGVIAYMKNPDITIHGLMKYIKGPDFPTGAIITNADEIAHIYETGEGKLKVRAKTVIEKSDYGRQNIVITEIPYTVAGNKMKLLENLVSLTKDKVFDEIYDVRDESSKEGIRLVIEVKKDRDVQNLLNGLYKKTAMEDTYGVNMLAVKDKQPITFDLKSLIQEFVFFQEELYTKEYTHLLNKANKRLEIVAGLIKATDVIDLIVEILRGSSSVKQAKGCLVNGVTTDIRFRSKASEKQAATLDFTETQADAILAMPLSRLVGLELLKLHQENDTLLANIAEYKKILGDKEALHDVIKNRLRAYKKQFNAPRHTELANITAANYVEEIKEEDLYVLIDRFGYTKSVDASSYSRIAPDTLEEYHHIVKHAKLAESIGMPKENIFISEIGQVLEFTRDKGQVVGKVTSGKVLIDGLGVGDVGNIVLRDRRQLSQDGILIVVVTMDKEGRFIAAGPDIVSRGFVYVRESEALMEEAKERVTSAIEHCLDNDITEWSVIKNDIREAIGRYLYEKTRRRPMILPIIMEV